MRLVYEISFIIKTINSTNSVYRKDVQSLMTNSSGRLLLTSSFVLFFFVLQKAYSINHEPPAKQQCVKNGKHSNSRGKFVPLRLPSGSENNGELWEWSLTFERSSCLISAGSVWVGCIGPDVKPSARVTTAPGPLQHRNTQVLFYSQVVLIKPETESSVRVWSDEDEAVTFLTSTQLPNRNWSFIVCPLLLLWFNGAGGLAPPLSSAELSARRV